MPGESGEKDGDVRALLEKAREGHSDVIFLDLTKAYDALVRSRTLDILKVME